jgi:hypothetical protein
MRQRGLDAGKDPVFPDLVFALPTPPHDAGDPRTVGVGVMAYYGGNDDRWNADEIHARYLENMKRFVRWLADSGHRIRLFTGDNRFDDRVVQEILADLRSYRPDLESAWAVGDPVTSLGGLMREIADGGPFRGAEGGGVGAQRNDHAAGRTAVRPAVSLAAPGKQARPTGAGRAPARPRELLVSLPQHPGPGQHLSVARRHLHAHSQRHKPPFGTDNHEVKISRLRDTG